MTVFHKGAFLKVILQRLLHTSFTCFKNNVSDNGQENVLRQPFGT